MHVVLRPRLMYLHIFAHLFVYNSFPGVRAHTHFQTDNSHVIMNLNLRIVNLFLNSPFRFV